MRGVASAQVIRPSGLPSVESPRASSGNRANSFHFFKSNPKPCSSERCRDRFVVVADACLLRRPFRVCKGCRGVKRLMNSHEPTVDSSNSDAQGERLEQLFDACSGELMGTVYYLVGNREDARDVLQEAFLKCWHRRDQLESVGNLRAWVFRVALNTARDVRKAAWNRRRKPLNESLVTGTNSRPPAGRRPATDAAASADDRLGESSGSEERSSSSRSAYSPRPYEDLAMVSAQDSPPEGLIQSEELALLRQAIAQLPEQQQQIFLLRQNGDMTYHEIAEAIGQPLGTVKTRMRSALATLRQTMGGQS